MERITIASIVEGEGEVRALPVLLRRIANELGVWNLDIPTPYRIPRSRLVKPASLATAVASAAEYVSGAGGVLVVLDADDDCPATFGPSLLSQAQAARQDKIVTVILPDREFEAWFLAAAESIAGRRGLQSPLTPPADLESVRDAKGWLSARCDHPYKPTVDQAPLAHLIDLAAARKNSRSFAKMWRDVAKMLDVGTHGM